MRGKKDDSDEDIYDDVYNPPVYKNLPCNENEKRDSGFEWQDTEECYSFPEEHIYESVEPYQK